MRFSGPDQNRHTTFDRRDAEIQQLKRERDELRARERRASAEAETAKKRLSSLSSASKAFASSIRGRVAERERARWRLTAQYDVGRVLAKAGNLDDAMPEVLKILGEDLGWAAGAFWIVGEDADALRCAAFWRSSDALTDELEGACRRSSFRRGSGLPGRVWAAQEPAWVEDGLGEVSDLILDKTAAGEGLCGALAFPIRSGAVFGVVELFDWKVSPPDEESLLAVGVIGDQIGQFVERRRAEEERERLFIREQAARAEAEAARREATDILENRSDAFFNLDVERRLTYVNRAAEQFWGRSREELLGRYIYEAFPQAVGSESYEAIERAVREGLATGFETISPVSGMWVAGQAYPSPDGVSVYFQDVTERKRAEEERERLGREAASERARFEAVLQQMPAGVFIADLDGEFFLHNEEAERVYGRPINSIEECGRYTYSYPDGGEIPPERYPLNRSLEHGEFISDEEYYVRRGDDARGVVRINAAPVKDEEGRIVAAVKAFEDVTWRKEAEAALKESEERIRTVVEGAPILLFALDREGVITTSLGRGLEALGLKPGELVGTSAFDFHAARPEIIEYLHRALAGEAFTANLYMYGLVFETSYSPLRDAEGEISGVIVVSTDVTERLKAQEERERSLVRERTARAQSEERRRISRDLHDRVAHSMAIVHQSLQLYEVLKERSPETAQTKMELARSMAREALDSTRNLSSELRRPEIQRSLEAALADLLRDVVPPEVNSHLSVEGDEIMIPSDMRDQLFLVLREAVRNAIKHSGCAQLAVELNVTPERIAGSVEDNGRGFAPEEMNGSSRSNGLRSMKERVSLVGGSVAVSSAPGEGTKVKLSVPLKEEA